MGNRLSGLLLLAALGLGGALATELRSRSSIERDGSGGSLDSSELIPTLPRLEYTVPTLDTFDETIRRPLFTASRRPPEPKVEPPPQVEPSPRVEVRKVPPLQAALSAIVINAGERLALLTDARGLTNALREGERLDGWDLAEIGEQSVVFRREGEVVEIPLRRFGPAGRPVARPSTPQVVKKRESGALQPSEKDEGARADTGG